jgi:hypothetical protein
VGLETVELLSPVVGVHEYVVEPEATIPMAAPVGLVAQLTVASAPALMVGGVVFTVTKIWSEATQPFAGFVAVNVYVVVAVGSAVGLEMVVDDNPVPGVHA